MQSLLDVRFLLVPLALGAPACASPTGTPEDVSTDVEGVWRSDAGATFELTTGDRFADCSGGIPCDAVDASRLDAKIESATCGHVEMSGSVSWAGGARSVRLLSGGDILVGDIVDGALTLRDDSTARLVRAADPTRRIIDAAPAGAADGDVRAVARVSTAVGSPTPHDGGSGGVAGARWTKTRAHGAADAASLVGKSRFRRA